jgi:uncharacterized protein
MAAKFEVYQDAKGKFGFRLKAANGQVIAQGSETYPTNDGALAGIDAVKRAVTEAHVDQGLSMRHS